MASESQHIFTTESINGVQSQLASGYKIPRFMNPFWKGKIGIRKPGIAFSMTPEEMTEYVRCANDIKYFAENYCKIKLEDGTTGDLKLRPYQKDILDLIDNNRFSILMASRQVGKTISTAISILHYCTFNNDKNVMIMANKKDTVVEIIDKIKNIYKLLPFFLKPSVGNWNQGSILFEDNKCRILSQGRSKEPAIGFTIDYLYMDEFAHIPANILGPFYRAIFPTVSNVENSKIVITSTPNGFNLFHHILTRAELPEGDINKNGYQAMRVYWYDVPNRNVTYIYGMDHKMMDSGVTHKMLEEKIIEEGWVKKPHKRHIYTDGTLGYWVEYDEETKRYKYTLDNLHKTETVEEIRQWRLGLMGTPLPEVALIETWMEKAVKDIGGLANFKQEYEIQFLTDGKGLLDQDDTERLSKTVRPYHWKEVGALTDHLNWDYENLQWDAEQVGDVTELSNEYGVTMIDLGEGLGADYTVFNLFKLEPMSIKQMDRLKNWDSVYDFFKLTQVGLWRSNVRSIDEAARLFYLLHYETLDPEKWKFSLEWNTYGDSFVRACRNVWDGENDFGTWPFMQFKHSIASDERKIGYKMTSRKPILIKDLQQALRQGVINITHDYTFKEVRAFSKKETNTGVTYQSETGNDDITMTLVGGAGVFKNVDYRQLVEQWMSDHPTDERLVYAERLVYDKPDDAMSSGDYSGIIKGAMNRSNYGL